MRSKTSYSMEEKQQLVNEFAKSGLTKWEFTRLHPEYKRTTIYSWLQKYFLNTNEVKDSTDASESTKKPKDSIGKFKMVLETAKMTEVEVGAYCRSNGIYASELNAWKVNCMNANNSKKECQSYLQCFLNVWQIMTVRNHILVFRIDAKKVVDCQKGGME